MKVLLNAPPKSTGNGRGAILRTERIQRPGQSRAAIEAHQRERRQQRIARGFAADLAVHQVDVGFRQLRPIMQRLGNQILNRLARLNPASVSMRSVGMTGIASSTGSSRLLVTAFFISDSCNCRLVRATVRS